MIARPASPPLSRRQSLWLLAAAAAGFLPLLPWLPGWLSALALAVMAWRGAMIWRGWRTAPRWLPVILAVAGAVAVGLQFRNIFGKDPGVALLALLAALKLLEMRSRRDATIVVMLGYFLVLTPFFYSQSIAYALAMVAALVVITAAQIQATRDGEPAARSLRLAGIMLVQGMPFMLALFVLFPRIPGPLWGLPMDAYSGLTGLSESMTPGMIANLSLSESIAFRVRFAGPPPAHKSLYWRGPVMTYFDGRTWRMLPRRGETQLPYAPAGPPVEQEITLEPHNHHWLFALELPASLPPDAMIAADYQMLSRVPVRTRLRYQVRSHPETLAGAQSPGTLLRESLQLPPRVNPRARELATRMRDREGADPRRIVESTLAMFRREAFTYTLTPPPLGADGVDDFLFSTRRGFCEHFAGSFVFLMRAAGVPARVVTGYQGGEINPVDGYLTVRQSDAHAWAEVWWPDHGWQRVDPTAAIAPGRIELNLAGALPADEALPLLARPAFSWLREARYRWDAVANAWNQWVLGYNPQRQRDFLASLGLRSPDWGEMVAALGGVTGLLLLALTAWTLRRQRATDPAQAAWDRLSRRLARQGLERRPWEGPRDYAERVAGALPAAAATVREIADLYAALRYGGMPDREGLPRLRAAVARFRPG